jgi:hypothetical protein
VNTLANLAAVTTATVGSGTVTLGAAVAGWLTFAQAGLTTGAVVTYVIQDDNGGKEIGQGTYTASGTTLSRDTVYRSTGASNTGKISLSGSAQVRIAAAAEDIGSALVSGTISGTTTLPGGGQISSGGNLGLLGTPAVALHVFGNNNNSFVASQLAAGPRAYLHNISVTDGNYSRLVFMSTNDAAADVPVAGITVITSAHANGAETADMVLQLRNAGTIAEKFGFLANGLFTLAGRTSSFPALKRSTTTIQARLADDSAYATLDALSILDSGAAPTGTAGSGYVRKTSPQITTPDIVGTATNDNAAAGSVGQYASASATAVSLSTGTPANITSVSLTAGDWDVEGTIKYNPAATTTSTIRQAGVTTTSGTLPTSLADATAWQRESGAITTGTGSVLATGVVRMSLSGTTTVFLVGQATFATSTMTADGILKARRRR